MAQPHPNKVAFTEGVKLLFRTWTALRLAVENEWGGYDSAEKRDWMVDVVVDYFEKKGKKVEPDELEEILLQIMNDEFTVALEDDSAYQIGKDLVKLYNECITGNHSRVQRLREQTQKTPLPAAAPQQQADDSSEDEGGNEDEDEESMDTTG
ncbi:uncharacterized protein VTP21DRAFT_448 [Calcarisporiella thermophila]|uniref:uncharacterized protein n=1 Tax=Calcarisporiella thermophila TaxID=911321 RepID=UPI003744984F